VADHLAEIAEINDCRFLFLTDLREMGRDGFQVSVAEGLPVGRPKSIKVGDVTIPDGTPVEIAHESRVFEIVWPSYVGYSVLNESYASVNEEEHYEGNRFRIYSKSRFIQFMSQATFACYEYPGPTLHYCIACEDHIVHVLSVEPPAVRRVRGSARSSAASESAKLIQ
jgi:hypothetical protein